MPFTILGVENPWNNPFAWFSLVKRALALLILPNHYPNMLVLEVGADRPGDLARILRIATPDAVVVTRLPEVPVHVEAYASPEAVRDEEFSPAFALAAEAPLIISADDPYAREYALRTPAHVFSFGSAEDAFVRISSTGFYGSEKGVTGTCARVVVGDEEEDARVFVKGSVGTTQMLPVAAAIAAAHAFGISCADAIVALGSYEPPAGRGRLLVGKNGSVLIDDSYNSSPVAVEQALATLKDFPHATRRIAVLGDMLELGRYSVAEHTRIGVLARDSSDIVVAVGIRARAFALPENTSPSEVLLFDCAHEAARALVDFVEPGDVVLIKGSQSIRTERIVKALLADPADSSLLVRQEKKWREKK